jgi:hypothetical protein
VTDAMKYGGAATRPRLGPNRSRRGAIAKWGLFLAVAALICIYIYMMFVTFGRDSPIDTSPRKEDGETEGHNTKHTVRDAMDSDPVLQRKRKIILATGRGRWNTGVWPAWGYGSDVTLNWAAAGVKVKKQCAVECEIAHEGSAGYGDADAVVMELTNHPKFGLGRDVPVPWPDQTKPNPRYWYTAKVDGHEVPTHLPLTGLFYYEPAQSYPGYTTDDPSVRAHIDFAMTPDLDSDLPVTLICPWGHPVADYLRIPPLKSPERLIAYFNEHGIMPAFSQLINELFQAAGDRMHSYGPVKGNRAMPSEAGGDPYQLARRIDFMGTYKFILVTEALEEKDYISPEWSHAILGGAVPVYIGTPNIAAFAPGPRSYIDIRDFKSGGELWEFLLNFDADDVAYQQWFEWKKSAKAAFNADEKSQHIAVGTGEAVHTEDVDVALLEQQIRRWAKPVVESLIERDQDEVVEFHETAKQAWRWFRAHVDHCVHYAECRMCQLVTKLT